MCVCVSSLSCFSTYIILCDSSTWKVPPLNIVFRVGLHHGPRSRTMGDGSFSRFQFNKISIYKAFGSLNGCKLNVDEEEWPCTKMWMCWVFKHVPKKFDHSLVFSCHHLLVPKKVSLNFLITTTFLCHEPWSFFLSQLLFCLSHRKTRWTISVYKLGLKISLLGISYSTITLTFFPWCKPKWSQDEFNSQSQTLQGLGTTSWSMV